MDIDWQYYQSMTPPKNLESDMYSIRENPFMGIDIDPSDEKWNERPDNKKYVVYPTIVKQQMDWKDFVVVEDFLTDEECDVVIKYQERKISLELANDKEDDDELYSEYSTYFRDEGGPLPSQEQLSRKKKVYNPHLNKYEFIPNMQKWCNTDHLIDETGRRIWRNSVTTFANPFTYGIDFLFSKVNEEVSRLNPKYWNLDIPNPPTQEPLQITKYEAPIGNYSWHTDTAFGSYAGTRKLSYVIQLSDPTDYEGGFLQLMQKQHSETEAPKDRGTLIIFPSVIEHRLTQVTKGTRYSAVGWITGNHWR